MSLHRGLKFIGVHWAALDEWRVCECPADYKPVAQRGYRYVGPFRTLQKCLAEIRKRQKGWPKGRKSDVSTE